jgi:hypothetical protein
LLFGTVLFFNVDVSNATTTNSSTIVKPVADLAVSQTASNYNPKNSDKIILTIKVKNNGPKAVNRAYAHVWLNKNSLELVKDGSKGTYSPKNNIWYIGYIKSGQTFTLKMAVKVISHENTIKNYVTCNSLSNDPNKINNKALVKLDVASNEDNIARIMTCASKFGYSHAPTGGGIEIAGAGDCWAMSDYLYRKFSEAKIKSRIIQYRTGGSSRHRSVQLYIDGAWVDAPYRKYGVNWAFNATSSKPGMFVLKTYPQ